MNMSFYVGAIGADHCSRKLSVVANNLANVNNNGFKPKTAVFSELINYNLNDSPEAVTQLTAGAGVRVQRTNTDFGVSAMRETGLEYDYAITQPNAFFMLQDPVSGEITYTRSGRFHRGEREDGFYLTTESGKLVLDQNRQPLLLEVADVEAMREALEGGDYEEDYEDDYDGEEDENRTRVSVYTFSNPSRLLSVGNNEYTVGNTGMEPVLVENPGLAQGVLEGSGTDMAKEITRMIECQRAFSFAARVVTTSDEITGTINSLRG